MKKKNVNKLKLEKSTISDFKAVKGGIGWASIPHTDCVCWSRPADPVWSNIGCSPS
ncbi:hypothetical protein U8527_20995 [Kordia algicida OT-1]|uniref:Uncharacterized protein n=1 Tax=Kordia algicida OT-1 TaxID=391587 RepID=A9DL58_9FLAO|nr:hypothetical protein [Kordia algicida]EDP98485.1 hypothetical protein KAOT1_14747 [Kordia algicida OT-1]